MTAWLIRSTLQTFETGSPAEMEARYGGSFRGPDGNAITNPLAVFQPDLSAVKGQPSKYWTLKGDTPILMDAPGMAAVDAADAAARKQASISSVFDNAGQQAALKAVIDVMNQSRDGTTLAKVSIDDVRAAASAKVTASAQATPDMTKA